MRRVDKLYTPAKAEKDSIYDRGGKKHSWGGKKEVKVLEEKSASNV